MLAHTATALTRTTARTRTRTQPHHLRSLGWFTRSTADAPRQHHPALEHDHLEEDHDLVIVGGGPAGLTLAAALASNEHLAATHSITLIEGGPLAPIRDWHQPASTYSNRVSSITADNERLLADAGIWQHVDHTRTRHLDELQVWDGLSDARIEFQSPFLPPSSSSSSSPFPPPSSSGAPPPPPPDADADADAWDAAYASALRPRRAHMSTLLENLNLQRAALRRIAECVRDRGARVELLDGRRVEGIERGEGGWPVVRVGAQKGAGGGGRRLRARLLIGADGANSPVKTFSNIDTFGWAYDRQGVVATVAVDPNPMTVGEGMSTGWQRFLPEGPIAFLPLSDSHASLVWSTTPAYAAAIKALPLDVLPHLVTAAFTLPYDTLRSFLDALVPPRPAPGAPGAPGAPAPAPTHDAPAMVAQLEAALVAHSQATYDPASPTAPLPPVIASVQPGSVASFPLRLQHTSSYLGLPSRPSSSSSSSASGPSGVALDARTALVGDAAHTVHPLAGQGLNLGLADAFSLSSLVARRAAQGADVGAYLGLKEYPRERYARNHAVLSACDHLASLYGRTDAVSVWARSTGLEVLNELEPLKRLVMGQAGGAEAAAARGGGGRAGSLGAGAWGALASVLEGAGKARDMVGAVGGAVVGQVGRRAAEFVVKGR